MVNKKIMLVDDNEIFLEELEEILRLSGYDTVAVRDTALAVSAVISEKPDLVILDLKMPGKSGFQLADEIRHLPEFTNLPIIAMTGFFKENYEHLLNICGIGKCLRKPFNPLDVIIQIEEVLAKN